MAMNRLWAAVPLATLAALLALAPMVAPASAAEDKLTPDGAAAGDFLGSAVAISGNTAAIGSIFGGSNSVHVFIRQGGRWAQQQKVVPSDAQAGDRFGGSVALGDDTLVVGAPGDEGNRGSVYVFTRVDGVWSEQQKLLASDGAAGDQFGFSVALSDETLVVTALGDDGARGSAYVFMRADGVWTEHQKVTASDGVAQDGFGFAVALNDESFVVGATSDDVARGSAYVFVRNGAVWTEQQKLTASDRGVQDVFGQAVAIDGDTIVVAAPFDDVGVNVNQGSAYVFVRDGGTWTEQQKLTASDGAARDQFGQGVAIRGNTILVGAPGDDVGANEAQGSAYVFARRGGAWAEERKVTASDGTAFDFFGYAVGIGPGDRVLIGAPGDEENRGSAYVLSKSVRGPAGSP
jgi:FG-GAP repeat protein